MKRKDLFLLTGMLAILWGCEETKMPLPSPKSSDNSFGANDTSYVELNPVWNSAVLGVSLQAPGDLTISADGVLFLADEGAGKIYALSKAGHALNGEGLDNLAIPAPRGLAMDSKLNLLIVNGSNQLFIWNQYLNKIRIDSAADAGIYRERDKNEFVTLTFKELRQRIVSGGSVPILQRYLFRHDPGLVAEARRIYAVYRDPDETAQFNGVAAGSFGRETVYVTDSDKDRILQLILVPDLALKGTNRTVLFHYAAEVQATVAVFGSGSGTVDEPWAITTDKYENIYFTQLGGNFRVQKLSAGNFAPRYVLYQHAIMDLGRFSSPYDIALDESEHIFVIDGGTGVVSKYANAGAKAGQLMSLGKKGLALAQFNAGRGLLISDDVVYIVEQGAKSIRRFQYSVSDSDIPDDEKEP